MRRRDDELKIGENSKKFLSNSVFLTVLSENIAYSFQGRRNGQQKGIIYSHVI